MITNSPQTKRDLPACLNHLASRRETERIFRNVVGAKMRLLTPTPLRSHLTVSEKTGKNPRINFPGFLF